MEALLTNEQRQEILHTSSMFTDQELETLLHLNSEDLKIIGQNRGNENKIGFAMQLCWIRFTGGTFSDISEIPSYIVRFVADKIGIKPEWFKDYGRRRQTRNEHFQRICKTYNYLTFDDSIRKDVEAYATEELNAGHSAQTVVGGIVEMAKSRKWVLPSLWTIESIVKECRDDIEDGIYNSVYSQLTPDNIKAIDDVLNVSLDGNQTRSRLSSLKEVPGRNNPRAQLEILEKLRQIQNIGVKLVFKPALQNKMKKIAASCKNLSSPRLREYIPVKKYALVAILLTDLELSLTDMAVDLCNRIVNGIRSEGIKSLEMSYAKSGPSMQANLRSGLDIIMRLKALVNTPNLDDKKWREYVVEIINGEDVEKFMENTQKMADSPNDYRSQIEKSYSKLRYFAPTYLELIHFKSDTQEGKSLLDALDKMLEFYKSSKRKMSPDMPTDFIQKKWEQYLYDAKGNLNPRYYELALFSSLRLAIQSGNIYVERSYSFKSINQDMISKEEFARQDEMVNNSLNVPPTSEEYMAERTLAMTNGYSSLVTALGTTDRVYIEDQKLHLKRLNKSVPKEAKKLNDDLYSRIPQVRMPDFMFEVDKWIPYSEDIKEAAPHSNPNKVSAADIIGAIIAQGTNLGIERMAKSSTGLSYNKLRNVAETYLTEDALRRAQASLVNYQHKLAMAKFWGSGHTSSSDGMRVEYGVDSIMADYNPHFGSNKGATFYRYTLDQYATYFVKVIYTNSRDARYLIDGLLEHEADIEIEEHYTDTAGYTDQVFGLCHLLGFIFAPRIRNLSSSQLYTIKEIREKTLQELSLNPINIKVIHDNYEDIRRMVYSIKMGYVPASVVLSKLSQKNQKNPLALALQEIGRIEKTIFLLKYLSDETLRRRVLVGLNKGEAMNALARTLFFGQDRKLRIKDIMGQNLAAMTLNIIINAVCIWNTVYLGLAYEDLSKSQEVDKTLLSHVSPLNWSHIIYQGEYRFDPNTALEENQFRDLVKVEKWTDQGR